MPSALLRRFVFSTLVFICPAYLSAQTIRVDVTTSHAVNTIKPTEALGAGIDRIGYGTADPDGPSVKSTIHAGKGTTFTLPAASVTVLRGKAAPAK